MRVVKPPAPIDAQRDERVVFLAGSIEMGKATDWQRLVANALARRDGVILNPRRDAWDASWRQSIEDDRFREQVTWELDGLDRATTIAVWFAPETRSPVTLLELGLHARSGKLVVGCPDGYWRKGNVEVVCKRLGITLCHDFASFLVALDRKIGPRAEHEGCATCAVLGETQYSLERFDARRPLLEIARSFEVVRECAAGEDVERGLEHRRVRTLHRCATCRAHWVYEWDHEYLVSGTEDEEWLHRVSDERAQSMPPK